LGAIGGFLSRRTATDSRNTASALPARSVPASKS
jgi:hypothetical protein